MTTPSGDRAGAADSFGRDWQAVRADGDIQFAPLPPVPRPETPDWLQRLGEFFEAIFRPVGRLLGEFGPAAKWLLIGGGIALALILLWRLREPLALWLGRIRPQAPEPAWTPDSRAALALLEDADRLAAEGRFDEATHLLLKRSVGQIAEARPACSNRPAPRARSPLSRHCPNLHAAPSP